MIGPRKPEPTEMEQSSGLPAVLGFAEIEQTQVAEAGGKGANLAELGRIDGIRVPPGFGMTTGAFRRIVAAAPSFDGVLDRLVGLRPDDREAIGTVSAEIRQVIEDIPLPDDLVAAVGAALARLGEHAALLRIV
jgi:rifampicin phosphotransferase